MLDKESLQKLEDALKELAEYWNNVKWVINIPVRDYRRFKITWYCDDILWYRKLKHRMKRKRQG